MFLGHQISGGGGPPKFQTEFKKSWSPSNVWQSLVTLEIRWRKKEERKKDLNYSGITECPAVSIDGGWAAIIIFFVTYITVISSHNVENDKTVKLHITCIKQYIHTYTYTV